MTAPRGPEDANNLQGGYQALGALDDFMAADAVEIVIKEQQASVPLLQRKLGIGADRAAKIIEAMEKDGIVGPQIAPFVPRRVLIQKVPENLSQLINKGHEQQPVEPLPSVDNMPSVFPSTALASVEMTEGDYRNGKGKITHSDGTIEEGEFKDGYLVKGKRINGSDMEIVKGWVTEGTFRERNLIKGRTTYPDGRFVDVDMTEGDEMDGRGKKTHEDGETQEGEFKGGYLAKGKRTSPNGRVQEGEFRYGQINIGKEMHSDGTIWEGSFDVNGKLMGMGIITYKAGTPTEVVIEGNFDQGVLNGPGKKTRKGATRDTEIDGNIEEGNYKSNVLHGRGKRTYGLGTNEEYTQDGIFESGFSPNSSFKEGTITYKNGEITRRKGSKDYTGEFDENLTGRGMMYDKESSILFRGTFENGVLRNGYKVVNDDKAGKSETITVVDGKDKVGEAAPSRSSGELDGLLSALAEPTPKPTPIPPTPHTFTPKPMNTPDSSDTSIETGERDPLFQKATEWISQQTGRASLTDLRLALNVPAVRTEAILVAMNDKKIVKKSGFMPFPQFFEYTPPAVPVAPTPIAAPVVAPVSTPVAPTPAPRSNPFVRPTQVAPDVSTPRLDIYDNEWTGVGDDFSGHGKVKYRNGDMEEGVFEKGVLVVGRQTYADGTFMDINMYKGNGYNGEGKKVWSDGEKHEGSYEGGALWNGTLTRPDGTVVKVVDGVQQGSSTSGAAPDTYREPIKGIRENATFGKFPKDKAAEANRGIERVENVCMGLPIEDQRRIGELHIKFKDRTPPAPGGLKGILAKRPTGVVPWRALDTNPGEGKTFVEIDPLRLPADDNEITQYLITVAKKYDNQRKAEMAIEDLERQTQVFGLTLNYDHGSPNFFKSLDGIEKIKKAMMMLDEDETGMLSRSDLLILMVGQKKEDYLDSKYRIILSCDTPQDENLIASYLRGELRRVEQEDAAGGAPSRKPTKKSVPGIFSKTRGKIAGVLAALAVAGGGAAAVHQINKKPTPVDTTPAPKAPKTPKAAEKAEEAPEAPVRAPEEAPKAPEKSAAESGEVKKVDLSKIPVGGKVSFTSPEDGVKKGVLKKNSRGKYEPVDAFDFDGDDDGTVVRIQ